MKINQSFINIKVCVYVHFNDWSHCAAFLCAKRDFTMAEDVKDDVTEIPTKRQKLDKDDDDYGIKQECTSSNNSATDKLVLSEDVPSTSSGTLSLNSLFSPLSRCSNWKWK